MDETNGTQLDASSRIVGELISDADVRIDGRFEGTIRTAGSLTVGTEGEVCGDLFGADIIIDGKVEGDVHAAGLLSIGPEGTLLGNIRAGGLAIADGSTFRGGVQMSRDRGGEISQEVAPAGDPLGVDQEGSSDGEPLGLDQQYDPAAVSAAIEVQEPESLDSGDDSLDDEPPLWDTDEHRVAETRALMESAYTIPAIGEATATLDDQEPPPRRSIDQLKIPKDRDR